MSVAQEYTQSVLTPQLRSLGLSKRQWGIVVEDVTQRLESLLAHWSDLPFRRTILVLGIEEASFWKPQTADLGVRSLVVVAVRNSLLTDLNADRAYTKELRSSKQLLPDERMPRITSEAIKFFQGVNLSTVPVQPKWDVFGDLPLRFPNAWHVLSLLGNSSDLEMVCTLPMTDAEPMDLSNSKRTLQNRTVVESGIDPSIDDFLLEILNNIEQRKCELFFSFAFKGITRNPEKLLSIIDHVLRWGGTLLTPNYLLSPMYLARRQPLLRPAHNTSEIEVQVANPHGLSERHRASLASLITDD